MNGNKWNVPEIMHLTFEYIMSLKKKNLYWNTLSFWTNLTNT